MNHRPLLNEPHGLLKDVEDDISLDGAAPLAPLSHQPEPLDEETRLLKQLDQALAIAVASPSNTTSSPSTAMLPLLDVLCPRGDGAAGWQNSTGLIAIVDRNSFVRTQT